MPHSPLVSFGKRTCVKHTRLLQTCMYIYRIYLVVVVLVVFVVVVVVK